MTHFASECKREKKALLLLPSAPPRHRATYHQATVRARYLYLCPRLQSDRRTREEPIPVRAQQT